MLKFALEMLWTERKKAYGLIVSIVTTLSICLLFLHFIINPYLAKKVTYDDILDFSEPYCIMLMGLFILMVCVSLICYSCNYYMKLHAREIGMLKMAGFNQGKVSALSIDSNDYDHGCFSNNHLLFITSDNTNLFNSCLSLLSYSSKCFLF